MKTILAILVGDSTTWFHWGYSKARLDRTKNQLGFVAARTSFDGT